MLRAAAPDGWGMRGPLLCAVALAALTGTGAGARGPRAKATTGRPVVAFAPDFPG